MMGTKEENKKFLPPSFPKKEKNWTPHESMQSFSLAAWNFYVQNSLPPFLAWTNGMATAPKNKKERTPPPPRKKPDPSLVHTEPLIGCMQLLFPKLFATIFGPGEFHLQRTPYPAFRMSMPRVLNASGTKGPPVTGQEVSWIFLSCEHNFVLGFWFLF
jgi:hypothetical protein